MTLETPQPENDIWVHDPATISPIVSISSLPTDAIIPEHKFKWFQVVMPAGGDTEQEKQEQYNAQLEQLRLGIIRMQQPEQLPPTQMNFQGGAMSQPIKIGQAPSIIVGERLQATKTSKVLDKIMGNKKIGPNEPCYCGSSKKYKRCHGRGL